MKFKSYIGAVILGAATLATAQSGSMGPVPSHGPAIRKTSVTTNSPANKQALLKPVAIVNGAVLTQADLTREMYAIFPYASQHNGFPKDLEPEIRKGALDMIIFEELLYQQAKRTNVTVSSEKLAKAEKAFRAQFPDQASYDAHIQTELNGSKQALQEKIRRSLLIEQLLKTEVKTKAQVTPAMAKAYYGDNLKEFKHGETVSIQTISMIPPQNASKQMLDETKLKITDLHRIALTKNTYKDFGGLAEQLSDDDWHTQMGDHKTIEIGKLPPPIAKAAQAMKVGQISNVIQLGTAYVFFRLNAHTPAGVTPFAEVKTKLQTDLQKQKTVEVRSALNQKLRKDAKIDVL